MNPGYRKGKRNFKLRPAKRPKDKKLIPNKEEKTTKTSGRRLWIFRLIALIFIPAFLILLLEFGLRTAGYGFVPRAITKCKVKDRMHIAIMSNSAGSFSRRILPGNLLPLSFLQQNRKTPTESLFSVLPLHKATPSPLMDFPESWIAFCQSSTPKSILRLLIPQ